jgi:hypothetical protein
VNKTKTLIMQNISGDRWMQHMRSGQFEEAWRFSDKIQKSGINRDYHHLPRHFQCIWDGTPLNGKRVLIRCYHGLGDTIHFIRYAPLVKEIAAEVIVWVQPSLLDLLKTTSGIDRFISLHDGTPDVAYDVDIEIMELPHVFRTTLATVPQKTPYLHVDSLPLSTDKSLLSVGIVWQSGDWNPSRDIPFSFLMPLAGIKGIKIYILQANALPAGWQKGFGIHPGEFTLYDYARVICGLDLMITVDSMPAHLAGALNVPVWVMLQAQADWRWMENRTNSPWYPSMKLFRQKNQGDWKPVIHQIAEELKALADSFLKL